MKKKIFFPAQNSKIWIKIKINSLRNWDRIYRGKNSTIVFDPVTLLFCCIEVAVQAFLTHILDLGICWSPGFGRSLFGWYWWVFARLVGCFYSPFLHHHYIPTLCFPPFLPEDKLVFYPTVLPITYDCTNTALKPLSMLKFSSDKRTRSRDGTFKFWNYLTLFQACLNKLLGLGFVCFNRTMKILHEEILPSRRKIAWRN